MSPVPHSPNFAFLASHDALLLRFAMLAERYVFEDPNSSLIKQRQLIEAIAKSTAAKVGLSFYPTDDLIEVLRALRDRGAITPDVSDLFHAIRKLGNAAVHDGGGTEREALLSLQLTRKIAIWYHRAFAKQKDWRPGPFVPPPNPKDATSELEQELDSLRKQLALHEVEAKSAKAAAEQEAKKRSEAEEAAAKAYADLEAALDLAGESELKLEAQQREFELLLAQTFATTEAEPKVAQANVEAAQFAASDLSLTEAETRTVIDAQLRDAGWEADTGALSYAHGTRPQKGRNLAIAEWPTSAGPADYALFAGLQCVGIVEAKKRAKNAKGAIEQAKRYSKGFKGDSNVGPWGDFKVPFLFATNGRAYLRQIEHESGVWFLDARLKTNHPRALTDWYTPEGLVDLLTVDRVAAQEKLADEPKDYLPLRDYQNEAVDAVEKALANDQRAMLVAMATGTGKTITCISLMYRLIKANRFRRVLFLVDRTALGEQAFNAFKTEPMEQSQRFVDIYDVKGLGDLAPDRDTKVHIATIQAMVARILNREESMPIDSYDCIVIDECHRGYNLDREMSEGELTFRSEEDYISKFTRVLDHFDAVKIGLTATPALHTTEIFGRPIYEYGYRRAVCEGWLVDHDPPVNITTELLENGIHYKRGEQVEVFRKKKGKVDLVTAPDDLDFDVEQFNKLVVTEPFNRAVCGELADRIDPELPGKTLIFCATDVHAELVVGLLKQAFEDRYGAVDDDMVMKITGAADRYMERIRRFKNERLPKIAVTVDLLTTGIDVPAITNLVFLRRVRSRILYEQMMGRATRLHADLYGPGEHKDRFRIFDAVKLYDVLQDYTEMKPVVANPSFTFKRLVDELLTVKRVNALDEIRDQILAKLQRRRRRMSEANRGHFETLTGTSVDDLTNRMKGWSAAEAATWFSNHPQAAIVLDIPEEDGDAYQVISHHPDAVKDVTYGYPGGKKPQDYIEGFRQFLAEHLNDIPALLVVTKRPRELTRKQLRDLRIALDQAGYSERALQTAYRELTNRDIAASIIGYVRQSALGDPLMPYEERVNTAINRILAQRAFTDPQRQWLQRIAKQLKTETVVDRELLDSGAFESYGGFHRINKVFDGKAEELLQTINEELWRPTG